MLVFVQSVRALNKRLRYEYQQYAKRCDDDILNELEAGFSQLPPAHKLEIERIHKDLLLERTLHNQESGERDETDMNDTSCSGLSINIITGHHHLPCITSGQLSVHVRVTCIISFCEVFVHIFQSQCFCIGVCVSVYM